MFVLLESLCRGVTKKGQSDSPAKEAGGAPRNPQAGVLSGNGGGATSPVFRDSPATPLPERGLCTEALTRTSKA